MWHVYDLHLEFLLDEVNALLYNILFIVMSTSDSQCSINDCSIPVIIVMSDNFELDRFYSGSMDRHASFNKSSFDIFYMIRAWKVIAISVPHLFHLWLYEI